MSGLIADRSRKVLLDNYGRLPIAMVRGEGSYLWDESGKRYVDLFAGFGAAGIAGHSHPVISKAISEQACVLQSHGNLFSSEPQVRLAEKIIENSFPAKIFFCHSGAESNEAALKLVRKRNPEKQNIISFDSCFHGRTYGALSLTPESFQEGCGAMLPGNIKVPYGNLSAVEATLDDTVGAIWMEPIQGEGGIHVPTIEFVQGVRKLCDKHDVLLVMDEVWTSPARTGRWFAYQHFDIVPDILSLAKAVGGGAPLAACVVAEQYTDILGPGSHGCTMGGNPLCAAAALAGFHLIETEDLLKKADDIYRFVESTLAATPCKHISAMRGRGAMIGLELADSIENKVVMMKGLAAGVNVCVGKGNIIRLAPALTITEKELSEGLDILIDVLKSF